jgi:hypothetical protein
MPRSTRTTASARNNAAKGNVIELSAGERDTPGEADNTASRFDAAHSYLRGTNILTPTGDKPIEDLAIGDLVVTRFSGTRPVKWIGRRDFAAEEQQNWPVRIHAGAFANHVPARDLIVSPGHSVLLDGWLIAAELLVNGVTITQEPRLTRNEYFSLDLGAHDCVIAEGAVSETCAGAPELRAKFANAAEYHALYPNEAPRKKLRLCAQLPENAEALNAALRPIAARAALAVTPGELDGYVEKIEEEFSVSGWAFDPEHPELPVLLEICIDDRVFGSVLACDAREDLAAAEKGSGRCAFTFKSPTRLKPELLAALTLRRAADGAELPMNPLIRPQPAPEPWHFRQAG